jgi:hypothetical protein
MVQFVSPNKTHFINRRKWSGTHQDRSVHLTGRADNVQVAGNSWPLRGPNLKKFGMSGTYFGVGKPRTRDCRIDLNSTSLCGRKLVPNTTLLSSRLQHSQHLAKVHKHTNSYVTSVMGTNITQKDSVRRWVILDETSAFKTALSPHVCSSQCYEGHSIRGQKVI